MEENIRKFKNKKDYAIAAIGVAAIAGILILAASSIPALRTTAVPVSPAQNTVQTSTAEAQLPPSGLTGKLTLYILPLEYGQSYQSGRIVETISTLIPGMAAAHYAD